jgi:predicted DCC family thiol-disulfide oxidoreductase YuxK
MTLDGPAPAGLASIPEPGEASTRITVLYDERCTFCLRCRDWLAEQPCLLEVELLPAGSVIARDRYGAVPWLGRELVVVDDRGRAWVGPAAFVTCLWATARYRGLAYTLSRPSLSKHVRSFFMLVSRRRGRWSELLARKDDDCSWCDDARVRWAP